MKKRNTPCTYLQAIALLAQIERNAMRRTMRKPATIHGAMRLQKAIARQAEALR